MRAANVKMCLKVRKMPKWGEVCQQIKKPTWLLPAPNDTICTSEKIKTSDPGTVVLTYNPRTQGWRHGDQKSKVLPGYTVSLRPWWDPETLSHKGREGLGKWLSAKVKVLAFDTEFELGVLTITTRHIAKASITSGLYWADRKWR